MARHILITGGNSGIGREMAATLAADGDQVIIASRDLARSQAAAETIRQAHGDVAIQAMALDLGDLDDVDRFAARIREQIPALDVLILNAGLYTHGTRALDNGLETMIGVMHFGHFRLTQQLQSCLASAENARVVVTSSVAHKIGRIRPATFDQPNRHWMALQAYAQAKLANLLFTRELARRVGDSGITANCFHPGAVATGIWAELPRPVRKLLGNTFIDSKRGADTGIWLARAPEAAAFQGEYVVDRQPVASSRAGADMALAARLWQETERRLAVLTAH
ncbi:SDR family NAD(P)-dependent oxidoreductase [Salinisphaera sp. Q1T1-3]|uniref:SDR family NAD(P)-dependent oxidoreductase n=1 Tax=Salinisphaera sp. Q1T1-3 TaxID=2321229 RepID=UPI000E760918|nr:SDR family NAD(P)-dependent oxidoreductase [Salinisphaera sp. Q1T1-3]RJS93274.1 SDR family NAD(P)-dependent oxidoreductase [Salinisphaera sp. Q1T1-3]